jgi:hypothetical protein
MNIGDFVYIYLFDLEKSIVNMKQLREDRFGKIIDIKEIESKISDNVFLYSIQLKNGSIINYRTDNVVTNIISLQELIELIGKANISSEKRGMILEQINGFVF